MTVTQSAIHYHLSSTEDFEQLIAEIAGSPATTLIVSTDHGQEYRMSTLEIAQLGAEARNAGKRLVLESDDDVDSSAALALGFVDTQRPLVSGLDFTEREERDRVFDGDHDGEGGDDHSVTALIQLMQDSAPGETPSFDTTADLATYRPDPPEPKQPTGNGAAPNVIENKSGTTNLDSEAPTADEDAFYEHASQRTRQPERFAFRRDVPLAIRQADLPNGARTHPQRRRRPRQRPLRRRAVVVAMAVVAPIVVLALIGGMVTYFLPSAVVTLAPVEDTIAADLTYGVALPGATLDIAIDPVLLSNRSTYEATMATSGERFEPDGTASGLVLITNPFTNDVTIPSGTAFPGANGVTYYTYEDALIPKADPFGSLAFGSETVGVVAGAAGPGGNLEAGSLTGQLATGLFYSNREPISGGTNRRIAVVAQSDVEALEQEVTDALLAAAEAEFLEGVPDGMQLLPSTIEVEDPIMHVSHAAGEDATEITASGTITVRGRMFDPEALHAQANDETGRRLASQAGAEQILLANSVHVGDPIPLDHDGTSFVISATATVRSVITTDEQAAILEQLAGMRLSDVSELLAGHEKIDSFEVTLEPSWLPDRMPELGSRIVVEVTTGESLRASR